MFETFLAKYRSALSLLLLGLLFLGVGAVGVKFWQFQDQPEIEVLGEVALEVGEGGENELVVEAAGAVIKPGVYRLPIGARVDDLLTRAGGFSAEADREWVSRNLNLAQKLTDGAKIYIPPRQGEGNGPSSVLDEAQGSGSQMVKININTASMAELDTLWGVGEATAEKIIAGRPYSRPEELLEKKIVKSNVWEKIKSAISVY